MPSVQESWIYQAVSQLAASTGLSTQVSQTTAFPSEQMPFYNQHPQQWDKEGAAIQRIYTPKVPGNVFIILNFSGFQQLFKNVLESAQCQSTGSWMFSIQLYGHNGYLITSFFHLD